MVKFDVFQLDVWGNEKDGYEINDSICLGSVQVEGTLADMTESAVLKAVCGFRTKDVIGREISVLDTTDRRRVYAEDLFESGSYWEIGTKKGHRPFLGLWIRCEETERAPLKLAAIREALMQGRSLDSILSFGPGQDCTIFKAKEFVPTDDIIYIPDVALNHIPLDEDISKDEDAIQYVIDMCYTGLDFVHICDGDEKLARTLFDYCDWQHPTSAYPELFE